MTRVQTTELAVGHVRQRFFLPFLSLTFFLSPPLSPNSTGSITRFFTCTNSSPSSHLLGLKHHISPIKLKASSKCCMRFSLQWSATGSLLILIPKSSKLWARGSLVKFNMHEMLSWSNFLRSFASAWLPTNKKGRIWDGEEVLVVDSFWGLPIDLPQDPDPLKVMLTSSFDIRTGRESRRCRPELSDDPPFISLCRRSKERQMKNLKLQCKVYGK